MCFKVFLIVFRMLELELVTGVGDRLAAETGTMSSLAYATIWANKRSCCSAKPGDGSTTPSNNNNNNNRLYLERVKTLKQ